MLGPGLFPVATAAIRHQVRHIFGVRFFCVFFFFFFLYPDSASILAAAMGLPAGATPGGGTARSLRGTRSSQGPPSPGAGRGGPAPRQHHCSVPAGRVPPRGLSHAALILPSPSKPLTGGWAGGQWGGLGGGQAGEWEDGAVDKAPTTKPVWNCVIWHSVGSCS